MVTEADGHVLNVVMGTCCKRSHIKSLQLRGCPALHSKKKKSIVYVAPTSLLIALEIFPKQDHPLRGQTNLVDDAAGAVKHLRDDRRHRSHNRSFCLCLGLQRESM